MTCNDCLHFIVCEKACHLFDEQSVEERCKHFKNKADFVEVVRCKNCKYAYFRYNCKDTLREIYACEKRPAGRTHKKVGGNFFCAHGVRK